MMKARSVEQIRQMEAPALAAGVPLMRYVATAIALRLRRELRARGSRIAGSRVVVLVGPGNNGGDGLFAAAKLSGWGVHVRAILLTEAAHAGGLAAARGAGVHLETVAGPGDGFSGDQTVVTTASVVAVALDADLILDAILGIGARGALRAEASRVVSGIVHGFGGANQKGAEAKAADPGTPGPKTMNLRTTSPEVTSSAALARRPFVVAVDVPSGIGVEDGTVEGPVLPADLTLGCGALVAGLFLPPAAGLSLRIEMLDLDLPEPEDGALEVLQDEDVAGLMRIPAPEDDKYRRGVVGVVAGTATYPGAAILAVRAAIRSGAGMVRYIGPEPVVDAVLRDSPEAVHGMGRVQAWVLGPGVDPADQQQGQHIQRVLGEAGVGSRSHFASSGVWGDGGGAGPPTPVVIDAGALGFVTERCPPWVVLTPHAGELATLLTAWGDSVDRTRVEAGPLAHARRAHELTGATILLKGSTTLVVGRGGVFAQAQAPPWLATAGAGDVLAGLLGTLLAGHSDEALADPGLVARLAALAALIHGRAASSLNPGGPIAAGPLAKELGPTIARLLAISGQFEG